MAGQLNNIQQFTHKNNYPSQMNIGRSEWGSVKICAELKSLVIDLEAEVVIN